jgi:hypothetical protein
MSTGAKKRIMKASLSYDMGKSSVLTAPQEYGECMADTPPGMKINFDEQNMTKWEVLMDGPAQSVYAVSFALRLPLHQVAPADSCTGRPLQARDYLPHRISLQATRRVFPNKDLPPQRQQR